jgi:hypothetical protein
VNRRFAGLQVESLPMPLRQSARKPPAAAVLDWFAQNPQVSMQTSTITQAEILSGIALLPNGTRRWTHCGHPQPPRL